jgi:hypothetical protein
VANETYSATSGSSGRAGIWSAIVTIDSVDQSARVVGDIRVEIEEGAARIAELTIRPAAGATFEIADWVGKPVWIDVADVAGGSPSDVHRLFSGLIDTPTLNLELKTIDLVCTDNLQAIIDAMDNATVDALAPSAYHSPVVFDAAATGWVRLQDRLSTWPATVELNASGVPRLTEWAAFGSASMTLTEDHILDGSLAVSLSSRHQMVNSIAIEFAYRFPRVKAECYGIDYQYVDLSGIAQFVIDDNWFLRRDSVEAAIRAAGGTIQSITFTPLPDVPIGTFYPRPYIDAQLCLGFSASVSFDYAQEIVETHTITVSTPGSIAAIGTLPETLSGALEGVYPPAQTAEQSILLFANEVSGIPPMDVSTPILGYTTAADVTLTADTDRAAANNAMETLTQVAKMRIWSAHRRNRLTATIPLNPHLDVDQTVDVFTSNVSAHGKVSSVSHVLSVESGQAISEFSLAICSVSGTGAYHPETPTAPPSASAPGSSPLVLTPTADFNFGPTEDHKITVTFPGVEDIERDLANIAIATSFSATIPEDLLEITL